jgi:hypothetical protein
LITTPTVLVLGAGASHPYGFPTGERLKREICATFSHSSPDAPQFVRARYNETGERGFYDFRDAFLKSGQPSIDAFLQDRPNFLHVGKFAIAYCLIPYEDESKLYECDTRRGVDWYQHLRVKLAAPIEKFGENRLSIITFNYDRSIEHYLLTALQNSHGLTPELAAKMLEQIPIIHIHGQLGQHPYPQHGCREYSPRMRDHREFCEAAAKGITLLHEEKSGSLEQARKLLAEADRIAFLGFGYHQVNIDRIAIDTVRVGSKHIIGTTRGLFGKEVDDVKSRIQAAFGSLMCVPDYPDEDSLTLLRSTMFLG